MHKQYNVKTLRKKRKTEIKKIGSHFLFLYFSSPILYYWRPPLKRSSFSMKSNQQIRPLCLKNKTRVTPSPQASEPNIRTHIHAHSGAKIFLKKGKEKKEKKRSRRIEVQSVLWIYWHVRSSSFQNVIASWCIASCWWQLPIYRSTKWMNILMSRNGCFFPILQCRLPLIVGKSDGFDVAVDYYPQIVQSQRNQNSII